MALKKIFSAAHTRLLALIICMVTSAAISASAQRDLIVTQAGEEIRCRILDETPTRFVYAYLGKKDKVLRNEIFKNLVTSFKYNYYDSDLIRTDKLPGGQRNNNKKAKRVDTRRTRASNSTNASKDIDGRSEIEPEKKEKKNRKEKKARTKETGKVELEKKEKREKRTRKEKKEEKQETVDQDEVLGQEPIAEEVARQPQSEEQKIVLPNEEKATHSKEELVDADGVSDKIGEENVAEVSKKELKKARKELKKQQKAEKQNEPAREKVKIENEELLVEPEVTNEFKNYLKWRVGAKAGLSNIINTTIESTNAYDLYREDLLKGWTFGADAAYFITEGFGVGAMFTNFMTSNKAEGLTYPNLLTNTSVDNGNIETNISNKYVGPVFYFRKGIDFKTFVVLGLSPGMYFYNESGAYNSENFNFKAQQFGGAATLGLDFLLGNDIVGRDVILSLEAGYNYSRFNEMDFGGTRGIETLSSPLVMDRLDFTIGLRFMRFPRYLRSK